MSNKWTFYNLMKFTSKKLKLEHLQPDEVYVKKLAILQHDEV